MRFKLFLFFFFFPVAIAAQNCDEIFNSIRLLRKGSVKFLKTEEKILPISFDSLHNDTNYYMIPNTDILYAKLNANNSTDFLKYNDCFYELSLIEDAKAIPFDMDILNANIVNFKYNDTEFISLFSTGTGLNKSGSFQHIGLNLIIARYSNKLAVNCFLNYVPDTISIMDFDDDNKLDYMQFCDNPINVNNGKVLLYRFNDANKQFQQNEFIKFKKKRTNRIKIRQKTFQNDP